MKKMMMMTSLAILIPLIVFAFIGCMKKPDHTPNYGPEATIEEMEKLLSVDVPPDPLSVKRCQFVSLDYHQTIDSTNQFTFRQRSDQVTSRMDPGTMVGWNFLVKENIFDFDSKLWKTSETQFGPLYMSLEKSETQSNVDLSTRTVKPQSGLSELKVKSQSSSVRTTFHNLKREDGFMPVPISVKNRENCGGVKNCDAGLRYIRLSFDQVVWDNPEGTKTTYSITYSPDIPTYIFDWASQDDLGFTNQMEFCAQTWIQVKGEGQKQVVPVKECKVVRDFQFGTDKSEQDFPCKFN